jgi:hypothetical protein
MAAGRAHQSSPSGTPGLGGSGFLTKNRAGGKGILTRGSLMTGWAPKRLAVVGTLVHFFSLAQGTSKVSLLLKLAVERLRLLLKLVETFNCGENRQKINL